MSFKTGSMLLILVLLAVFQTTAQIKADREIAGKFAPVFYQALGDKPRSDYITNFDFDGDWRGDNNWENTDNKAFALRGYIYYAVSETQTHYFIHYAVFHPRDYKGGDKKGVFLSELLRQGAKIAADKDPTGLLDEATLAHENDMEGALVVIQKAGMKPVAVETLHHNKFSVYLPEGSGERPSEAYFKTDGDHVLLYVEPKGHGIEAYNDDEKQKGEKEFLIYSFAGKAEDAEKATAGRADYDLVPISSTLWLKAKNAAWERGLTFGEAKNFGSISIEIAQKTGKPLARKVVLGSLASAFKGTTGGVNMARPPWGWFDNSRREDPPGIWFFDPAKTVKRDLSLGDSFSIVYVRPPFWADAIAAKKP